MKVFCDSYEEMMRKLAVMEREFPGRIRTRTLEVSADGRLIVEAVLGDEASTHHLLVHAGIHGREYLNTALVMRQTEDYLNEGGTEGVCFHVLPMVNPDGCAISQKGVESIRALELREFLRKCFEREKSAGEAQCAPENYFRRWKANALGVDINRNFGAGWERCQESAEPGAKGYRGRAAETEAETRAVLKVRRDYPLDCCIAYHSSGGLIYWDYGSRGLLWRGEKRLAESLARATGYELHSAVAEQAAPGGCSDYFVLKCGIPAVTVETGEADCPLPESEFFDIYARNRKVWRTAALFCLENPL